MKQSLSLITVLITLNACNVSPVLNHKNTGDGNVEIVAPADENCPLSYPNEGLCAKIEWLAGPRLRNIEDTCLIKFWDKNNGTSDGPFVDPGHEVEVEPWMKNDMMDHGTSPVTVTEQETGVYKATRIWFLMTGLWQFRVKLMDGTTDVERAVQMIDIK